jgi:hypothetical protein
LIGISYKVLWKKYLLYEKVHPADFFDMKKERKIEDVSINE